MESWFFLLWVPLLGWQIYRMVTGPRRLRAALEASFNALSFQTPSGIVAGSQLRVVKKAQRFMDAAFDQPSLGGDPLPSDAFWYCVAPGPAWFLSIPVVQAKWRGWQIDWIIRPLTEPRMRAALGKDVAAQRAAFGDSIEA